jgi:hypothetical protein
LSCGALPQLLLPLLHLLLLRQPQQLLLQPLAHLLL